MMISFFFLFILWEAKNDDKLILAENWATMLSSYQFTNGWTVHDARSFHSVAFEPWINIRQFRHLQPTNRSITRAVDTLVSQKLQWKESLTCANRSMVRRKRRARSPSSMAHSIIISLHVRPEAQASTMPANWLSRQQGIYKPPISLQHY